MRNAIAAKPAFCGTLRFIRSALSSFNSLLNISGIFQTYHMLRTNEMQTLITHAKYKLWQLINSINIRLHKRERFIEPTLHTCPITGITMHKVILGIY